MNDPPHPGILRGLQQNLCIGHRLIVIKEPVIEPHPVSVDERVHSLQCLRQEFGLIKVERESLHLPAERIIPFQGIRECQDAVPRVKQAPGNVTTGIAESTCDRRAHEPLVPQFPDFCNACLSQKSAIPPRRAGRLFHP
jgi:hypothetical protein